MFLETIFQGGNVIDGSRKPGYVADVGISNGIIQVIGELRDAETERRIDVFDHVVAPGFIDMHSHSDRVVLDDPLGESKIYQGVTIEMVENCGSTPFPVGPVGHWGPKPLARSHTPEIVWGWTGFDGWAQRIEENGASYNIAGQVGHSSIRTAVSLLENRKPTSGELKAMQNLVIEAIDQGCFSLSTGLTLPPSAYAATDEIAALYKGISQYDGAFYVSHARVWGGNHVGAAKECIEVRRRAGVPVQYSHMAIIDSRAFGDGPLLTGLLDKANQDGVDATYDMYPYTAAGTHLQQLVPEWVQDGGTEAMLALSGTPRFENGPSRTRLRAGLEVCHGIGIAWC